MIDPHTACGYHVFEQVAPAEDAKARVLLSTASPYKFPRACCDALGLDVPEDDFEAMRVLEQATNTIAPAQLAELESKPVRFEDVCDVDEMASYDRSKAAKNDGNQLNPLLSAGASRRTFFLFSFRDDDEHASGSGRLVRREFRTSRKALNVLSERARTARAAN